MCRVDAKIALQTATISTDSGGVVYWYLFDKMCNGNVVFYKPFVPDLYLQAMAKFDKQRKQNAK